MTPGGDEMSPHRPTEEEPLMEPCRDVFDLLDNAVARITDSAVAQRRHRSWRTAGNVVLANGRTSSDAGFGEQLAQGFRRTCGW
ncbi:MAG TPA: hypothetical protein VLW50_15500 [Streptosporangiaceae bacterium]|nr:hypothetical protein [Streptosporangiaceae bacterium]